MLQILFIVAALAHLVLLTAAFRLRAGVPEWLIRLLLLGMLWDNAIIALGPVSMDESWYPAANAVRYLAHVLIVPTLVIAALFVARRAGLAWANSRTAMLTAGIFVVAAIDIGIVSEIAGLQLVPETLYGFERLVRAHGSIPLATIATNVVILAIGAAIWRRAGWPWLFAVCLLVLLVNGATSTRPWSIVAGNVTEIVFAIGWLLTLRRFPRTVSDHGNGR